MTDGRSGRPWLRRITSAASLEAIFSSEREESAAWGRQQTPDAVELFGRMMKAVREQSTVRTLADLESALESKDPYTRGHSARVEAVSAGIANSMGLERRQRDHLKFAALLHDVGKICVRKDILRKADRLTAAEREEMRTHPERGVDILEPVKTLAPVLPVVRHHHENYDGTGYPDGLSAGEIPLLARIIKIADAWDAMTSERPYRQAFTAARAKQELKRYAGIQFDPMIVEVFLAGC